MESVDYNRDAQILIKSRSNLKILGARRVRRGRFHTEDLQMLSPTVKKI